MLPGEEGNLKRSLGPNALEDDPVMRSFIAAAYCIVGVKVGNKRHYLSPDRLATVLGTKERLSEDKINVDKKVEITEKVKTTRNVGRRNKKCKAINIITGEEIVFESYQDAAEHIDRKSAYITDMVKNKRVTKDGWRVVNLK